MRRWRLFSLDRTAARTAAAAAAAAPTADNATPRRRPLAEPAPKKVDAAEEKPAAPQNAAEKMAAAAAAATAAAAAAALAVGSASSSSGAGGAADEAPAFSAATGAITDAEIHTVLGLREAARKSKNWAQADLYREQLRSRGVDIFDRDREWKTSDGRRGVIMTEGAVQVTNHVALAENPCSLVPTPHHIVTRPDYPHAPNTQPLDTHAALVHSPALLGSHR